MAARTSTATQRSVYDFTGYKEYLRYEIDAHREVYGYQTKLAAAAGCQRSFLSQALNSHVHLTPEHASALAKFFGMNDDELTYWLDLVIFERAGTTELREFQLRKLRKTRDRMRRLTKRIGERAITASDRAAEYYATWLPSAVHVLITIPEFQTPTKIARRIGISEDQALTILQRLKKLGLAEIAGGRWQSTQKSIHLPVNSPFTVANHRNWREIALQEASIPRSSSVHFTGVYSLSREDRAQLQELILNFLVQTRERIVRSPEEEFVIFLCDYFVMDRS